MSSLQDDRGYNQGFKPSEALTVRTARRCQKMLDEITDGSDKTVLELGCGTGELSYMLSQKLSARITGVDLCLPFIEQATAQYVRENLEYRVQKLDSDASKMFDGQTYDYIVGNGILHHLYYNLESMLPIFKRGLKKGGKIIFWEPNLYNPYVFFIFSIPFLRQKAKLEPDEMAFTGHFIRNKLMSAGFTNIKTEYRDFLLPNTPAAMIKPVVSVGGCLEKISLTSRAAQSIFITADTQ
jgi:2-polyprenyl-3-methyl-5-hydroxy-6-metoxy-1,4-benzoquinol methylase